MYKILLTLILLKIGICLKAQSDIDFFPKMLQKQLLLNVDNKNHLSEVVLPDALSKQILLGKFFVIRSNESKSQVKYIYIGRVNTCRAGGCPNLKDAQSDLNSEFFDYFILFDSSVSVQLVRIFNYQATHGHEVSAKHWLQQFVGYNGDVKLATNKNIDAISGATISVDATTMDIEHKTLILKHYIKNLQYALSKKDL